MIEYVSLTLVWFVLMAGQPAALAQEPRHIEIRIINPSPSAQQPQKQEPAKESAQDKVSGRPGPSIQSDDISRVVRQSMPAVVTVITSEGLGSGFFVTSDGYLLTNSHVIRHDGWPSIRLADGTNLSASVVKNDEERDLALLKVSGSGYPALSLGDSNKSMQGESVIAIGSPIGLEGTVTKGIISAVRKILAVSPTYRRTPQSTPAIAGGRS
jgi:S1-C subfamily serine protease